MSCNASSGDKANLAKGHYSSRVLAPTGGGKTTISLGGGYGNNPKRTPQQRGLGGVKGGGGGRNNMVSQMGNMKVGGGRGVRRAPQNNRPGAGRGRGAAGGAASVQNMGGYGTYSVEGKPSSRVLAPTGGGKTTISLGGGYGGGGQNQGRKAPNNTRKAPQQSRPAATRGAPAQRGAQKPRQGAAGGAASQKNMGGYGTYNVNNPSSRVLAQPGGGSSGIFGGATDSRKTNLNSSQQRAKASLQSNVFGGPTQAGSKKKTGQRQPGGGTTQQARGNTSTRGIKPTGGGSNLQLGGAGRGQVKRGNNMRQPGGGMSQQSAPRRGVARPTQQRGAAGGAGAVKNSGGYGNLDIHSKPSSRVLNQPGGGSSSQGLF